MNKDITFNYLIHYLYNLIDKININNINKFNELIQTIIENCEPYF